MKVAILNAVLMLSRLFHSTGPIHSNDLAVDIFFMLPVDIDYLISLNALNVFLLLFVHIFTTTNYTDTHFITARKRSLGQGNIFTPVCHSVHRGVLPQCMLGYHHPPRTRHPPGADPPGTRHPPPEQSRACWEIRSTSGRYASYWNAILFKVHSIVTIAFDVDAADLGLKSFFKLWSSGNPCICTVSVTLPYIKLA